jgi:type II secretory pathway pseudopilin PulG
MNVNGLSLILKSAFAMFAKPTRRRLAGFTLIEVVAGIGVLAILLVGILGVYTVLTRAVKINREKIELVTLVDSYLEIARNLPYDKIGTVNGNPHGNLPDLTNPVTKVLESDSYKIYYEVTYIDDPSDGTILAGTDSAPNDYKQVKVFAESLTTGKLTTFVTTMVPKGPEGMGNSGALFIKVFNAEGQPVEGASIHIENTALTPNLVLDRTSDASGQWVEVGLPPSVTSYHIVVTKQGYSTDQTYPITPSNPNPVKPDATIIAGQITQISFSIDQLSTLTVKTLSPTCQNLSGVGVNVRGDKLIGTNPDIYKFNNSYSSSAGQIVVNDIEWDTYTPTLLNGQNYTLYGTSPVQNITLLPGTSQVFSLILGPFSVNSLRVIVKDAATGTPLEGALVHLRKGGSVPQDYYGTTGGSVWVQQDWTDGPGQSDFINPEAYYSDNGNIDINSVPTGVRLVKISGRYVTPGVLESSTFDTGTSATHYLNLTWEPTSQSSGTTLKFQIATNNDKTTWNFVGPDGTVNTYYTVSGTSINALHNGDRYVRYRVYESTTDDKHTPILTSVAVNYVSGCFTPGQTAFPDLTAGNNYDLFVSLSGYADQQINSLDINGNQYIEVLMSP